MDEGKEVGVLVKNNQKNNKKKSHIPLRMNILFFTVFVMFSILILRLGVVQIVEGEEYKNEVRKTEEISVNHSVPRGELYDSTYKKVVYNVPQKAITYTPPKNPQPDELYEIAKKLAKFIQMPEDDMKKVTERDKKDIWLLENKNGKKLVTRSEEKNLKDKELYQLKLERITEEQLQSVDMNVAAIYRKIYSATALTPTIVKNINVTDEEYAAVSENLANLPGVDVTTDWERAYQFGDVFRGMLGSVKQGLPEDKVDFYQSKGYSLNDRVGYSYIEQSLEDILQGSKAVVKTETDKSGKIINTESVSDGKSGKDVVLTVDMELQAEVERILQEHMAKIVQYPRTNYFNKAFVVVMNPKTGEILSLAGKQYNRKTREFEDYANGTFTYSFEPGSVIKGATVLMGYQAGVIKPGNMETDEKMVFKNGTSISSVSRMGLIDDLTALERSSNIYMAKVALKVAGGTYKYMGTLNIDLDKINVMRSYFAQFGLGTKTGIGFDNEVVGIQRAPEYPGQLLYFGFGQYDTYTPLQLAQYVSTIANDGYRMKPQLVKEIREPNEDSNELGPIIEEVNPVVLNRVDMQDAWIKRVQEGFWRVVNGSRGTARNYFKNVPTVVAGKTGTAQSWFKDEKTGSTVQTENLTFVGYAPYDNPEVAISVVLPNLYTGDKSPVGSVNLVIAQEVLEKYFSIKADRAKQPAQNQATGETTEQGTTETNP
ncbi:penicillin-binding protein 2 [Caldibacillus sp. 210928-DFI.2.22]|uniref:peptidoglycan D,D-transpeptidase FtsI family protein n=2 Tax=unclassified Caldibacillus TaxID=2641266 RepID=UPI001D080832|nr:penicillin-binding protein 2 [Caldibacillus sp. 210928-DFI.2.22]